jgi:peptidoglycan/LPS O-acetylase OafA/YrhL
VPPPSHQFPVKYRPDIDGLRAVAVLSVVGYHAFPGKAPGGFIGVDVFFVISGFLITAIILNGLAGDAFTLAGFYARRIRRIFPSVIVVLAVCVAFGWYALLADEFKQLGKHAAAGAGFVVNLVLAGESGYFDNAAETKPLLHLWSLGIEEQFYILWPLVLLIAWRRKRSLPVVVLGLAALSFIVSLTKVGSLVDPFYSPTTRAWELLTGGALALGAHGISVLPDLKLTNGLRNALSIGGALLVALAVLGLKAERSFPGAWALVPTLGAAALIWAGPAAWVNRAVLGNRVLVWIGLISFPLYLWHWPLLTFARIIESEMPPTSVRAAAVLLSIGLAWLTTAVVERPIRFGTRGWQWVGALALMMALVGTTGYAVSRMNGVPSRTGASLALLPGDIGHLQFHQYPANRWFTCTPETIAKQALMWEGFTRCLQSQEDEPVEIALVGDSHAEHLFIGLAEALPRQNVAFYIKSGLPFLNSPLFTDIYAHVLSSPSIKKVILTMYWAPAIVQSTAATIQAGTLQAARALLDRGKEVFITDDVPTFPFMPEKCGVRRRLARNQVCFVDRKNVDANQAETDHVLEAVVATEPRIRLIRTRRYFCDDINCSMAGADALLYRDANHLNINGSRYVVRRILKDYPALAGP